MSKERYRGCLLGLAVGDAVGTTVEFSRPGTFPKVTDMVGGGPFNLEAGQWTDDTSLALCLADSLVACKGFNPHDQATRYLLWYRSGYRSSTGFCFDIGGTTQTALRSFSKTNAPIGPVDGGSSGNGSLMRLAPVPMFYAGTPETAITLAGASSQTTHGSILCVDACRYYAGLIVGALQGQDKETLLSPLYSPVPGYWDAHPLVKEISNIAEGSYKEKQPPEIRGFGYVVDALEAALWAFYHSNTFQEGCLLAVNLGDDADTTVAIYGQIAGAYYGESGIPEKWLQTLYLRDEIADLAESLR